MRLCERDSSSIWNEFVNEIYFKSNFSILITYSYKSGVSNYETRFQY